MENNKVVYIVEVVFDGINDDGASIHSNNITSVHEDVDTAIRFAMINADSDLTEEDVKAELEGSGMVEIWWHPMKVGDIFAKRVYATISEHVLITKGS